jgi:hypothetical protein
MRLKQYQQQEKTWPQAGQHIMAQFDDESIIVYQAYSPLIANFAIENQYFGGAFSYTRMSWIKPNFLWMMYRSGWAQKQGQVKVLAVRLKRHFFDYLLSQAVPSTYDSEKFETHAVWQDAVTNSDVRLQWDPDHDPYGNKCSRRAIQLGLRGNTLLQYGRNEIISIEDATSLVHEQFANLNDDLSMLWMPEESIYPSLPTSSV